MHIGSPYNQSRCEITGHVLAIRGRPGSGKSRLAANFAAEHLAENKDVVWVDADRTLRTDDSRLKRLIIARPIHTEDLAIVLKQLLGCTNLGAIIIDALDALPTDRRLKWRGPWNWSGEDELFRLIRAHAALGVFVVYTEHAARFTFGYPTPIGRLSRRLSTDLRIVANSHPTPQRQTYASHRPQSHVLQEPKGQIVGLQYLQS